MKRIKLPLEIPRTKELVFARGEKARVLSTYLAYKKNVYTALKGHELNGSRGQRDLENYIEHLNLSYGYKFQQITEKYIDRYMKKIKRFMGR